MVSFSPLMNALGLRCLFVVDEEAERRLKERLQPRNGSYARTVYTLHTLTDRKWSRIQKLGRAARWEKIPKAQRSAIMRAVRAGHRKRSAEGAS
jgi:hypothetical protein